MGQKSVGQKITSAEHPESEKNKGIIFDIQRYALHDGSGIRTLVFLKGCPLKCGWCSNPESQFLLPELGFFSDSCIGCHKCITACEYNAIEVQEGKMLTDREKCQDCYHSKEAVKCASVCPSEAREKIGKYYSVDEVMEVINKDQKLYKQTDGGVTLSGGEPTEQPKFALNLLKQLKENWIDAAMETCGYCQWEIIESFLPYLDTIFYDFKIFSRALHEKFTGAGNDLIKENLQKIGFVKNKYDLNIIVRVPVIPNINDQPDNIEKTSKFVSEAGIRQIEFLKYHKLGRGKYASVGKEYQYPDLEPPVDEDIKRCDQIARKKGLTPVHFE